MSMYWEPVNSGLQVCRLAGCRQRCYTAGRNQSNPLSVPEYVKKAVKDALSENSYIGMVLDVNMYKRVGKEDEVNVSDSGTEFKMKFTILMYC